MLSKVGLELFFELISRYGMICHENNPILGKFPYVSTELPMFSVWKI